MGTRPRNRLARPLLAFIILVAVGADYNMLLVSRLREESGTNIRVGVLRTVANTGAVITSAGLIFAASMFGLMVGSVAIMIQAGLIIGFGLLLDTFLVRTLTVPAIATLYAKPAGGPPKQQTRDVETPSRKHERRDSHTDPGSVGTSTETSKSAINSDDSSNRDS